MVELKAENIFLRIVKTRGANTQSLDRIWSTDEILFGLNIYIPSNGCLFFFFLSFFPPFPLPPLLLSFLLMDLAVIT